MDLYDSKLWRRSAAFRISGQSSKLEALINKISLTKKKKKIYSKRCKKVNIFGPNCAGIHSSIVYNDMPRAKMIK